MVSLVSGFVFLFCVLCVVVHFCALLCWFCAVNSFGFGVSFWFFLVGVSFLRRGLLQCCTCSGVVVYTII